ncbi:MAG: hypothetical protein H6Q15_1599 [Bacteroidetes bacterium]|nr:hypothetical protein [Bacteroidota bacterium]
MRYELEKYKGQSTRFTCPSCGEKRAFTRYIDTITKTYLGSDIGICNRLIKCGYHRPPRMGECNSPNNNGQIQFAPTKTIIPIKNIDPKYMTPTIGRESNFLKFLGRVFSQDTVGRLVGDYYIAGTKNKEVIFWQIDSMYRVRTGKIIQYDPQTGKRIRRGESNSPNINWVHSALKKQGKLPEKWLLTQCLFGEHLINKYPQKPICLVEGEKTAVIMSGFEPDIIWMATGGVQNLNKERIYPIKNHPIMAFPDLKCFEKWKEKADKINSETGSRIIVSYQLENEATKEEIDQGLDIADFMLKRG